MAEENNTNNLENTEVIPLEFSVDDGGLITAFSAIGTAAGSDGAPSASGAKDILITPGTGNTLNQISQLDFKFVRASHPGDVTEPQDSEVKVTLYPYGERAGGDGYDSPVLVIGGTWNGTRYAPSTDYISAASSQLATIWIHPRSGKIEASVFSAPAGGFNGLTLTANADGWTIAGGTTSRSLTITSGNLTLTSGNNNPNLTIPNTATATAVVNTSSFTQYGVVFSSSATNGIVSSTAQGASGQPLVGAGASNPVFGNIDIANYVTGILGVGNGGTGTSTTFTTGSIIFAGANGVYTQDNANLFWDNTNNTLGVGTTRSGAISSTNPSVRILGTGTSSATSSFEVQDSGTNTILFVRDDGAVTVGTNSTGGGLFEVHKSQNNDTYIAVRNSTSGIAASAGMRFAANSGGYGHIKATSDAFTAPAGWAEGFVIEAHTLQTAGLWLSAYTNSITLATTATNAFDIRLEDNGTVGFGLVPSAHLHAGRNLTLSAWGTSGAGLRFDSATYTDSSSSGTVASAVAHGLAQPTFAASVATTYTNAASLYISNAPASGANVTITNAYALWVDAGIVRFDGNVQARDLTSGRVTYAGTNGLLQDSANFTFDGNRISLATTGNTGGLLIGGDANLYRSAADVLKTDDSFIVGANLSVLNAGTLSLYESGSVNFSSFVAGTQAADLRYTLPTSQPSTNQVLTATSVSGAGPYDIALGWSTPSGGTTIGASVSGGTAGSILFVGTGPVLAQDNANFYWDDTNNTLGIGTTRTGAISGTNPSVRILGTGTSSATSSFEVQDSGAASLFLIRDDGLINFGSSGTFTNSTGRLALSTTGSGAGILIGGDANLYRSAADTLKTDDSFVVGVNLSVLNAGTLSLYESGSINFSSFAAGTQANDIRYTLPTTQPSNNQILTATSVTGSGPYDVTLTWVTPATSGITIGDGITGSTVGSVLFVGAGSTLAQDNANFYWDDTNNTLGIGTTRSGAISGTNPSVRILGTGSSSATSSFEVQDSGANPILFVRNDSRVGIGTNAPSYDLSLGGEAARTIGINRRGTGTGNNLTVQSGGAQSGGTNLAAGTLILSSGTATGNGAGYVDIYAVNNANLVGGTTDNTAGIHARFGSGRIGLGTSTLTYDITLHSMVSAAPYTYAIGMLDSTISGGHSLNIQAGHVTTTADLNGGSVILTAGNSTGSGSSSILFYTATAGGSGTTVRTSSLKMTLTGAGQLQVSTTGSSAGILLGGDAQIYRSAADTLRTPDSLIVEANLTVGSLTSTRVPFASTGGLLVDSSAFTFITGTGQLVLSTTGSSAGILIGGDTQIYRSAADTLRTPDSFVVDSNLTVSGTASVGAVGGTTGTINLVGSTSGTVSVLVQAAAGTYNFNLPTTAGSSGHVLTSAGGAGSPMTWTDPATLAVRWNSIANPNGAQSLTMSTHVTTWNWATGTSTNNLFNLTTDASANGTGALLRVATGTSSTVVPMLIVAAGTTALTVNASAQVLVNSLTSGRVTYAGTNGLLQDSANMTFDGNRLTLATTGNTGGLLIGGDANLYRSAADTLKTDDSFVVGTNLSVLNAGTFSLYESGSVNFSSFVAGTQAADLRYTLPTSQPSANQVLTATGVSGAGPYDITLGWVTNSASITIGDAVNSGTPGSVLFVGTGPVLAQDNANFYWDDTNNTLGVGTTRTGAISGTNPSVRILGTGTSSATSSFEVQNSSAATILFVRNDSRVGIGTNAPSSDLAFGGEAARTIALERRGTGAGNNLTIQAGGGQSGGTDLAGGTLILNSGIATGSAASYVEIYAVNNTNVVSGTSDNPPAIAARFGAGKASLGTTTLTYDLTLASLISVAPYTYQIGMLDSTLSGGHGLQVQAGHVITTADLNGGTLTLTAGNSTGSGSSSIIFQTATAGGSGTTVRTSSTKMTLTGAGQLQVSTTGSGAGILLGGDAQLYRSAADTLRTPDSLTVDASLVVGTLTSGRVTYASTSGLLADSPNFTYTTIGGQLGLAATGSGGGVLIGGDAQLYRSAADVLRTPDSFTVDVNLTVSGTASVGAVGGTTGTINLVGSTSGTISVLVQAAAGTYNFNLPTTAGNSGEVLTSAGGGGSAMTWTAPGALAVRWSSLANPTGNLSLSMSTNTTTFNWATGTSTNNLFNLTTDASANGTGALLRIATGTSSTVVPLLVVAAGTTALTVNASAQVLVNSLTSGRVTFAGTSGLLTDSSAFTYTTGTGQLALSTTGSAAGILLGGDAQWYRGSADRLETTDEIYLNSTTKGVGVGVGPTSVNAINAYRAMSTDVSTRVINGALEITGAVSTAFPYGIQGGCTINATTNAVGWAGGLYGTCRDTSSQSGTIGRMFGFGADAWKSGTSNVTTLQGFTGTVSVRGTATGTITTLTGLDAGTDEQSGSTAAVTNFRGIFSNTSKGGGGNWTNYYGVDIAGDMTGGTGTISNWHGMRISQFTATGPTITTQYGLRIGDMTKGATNYAIYLDGTSGLAQQGIWWNGDVNLYRSAADVLATDDHINLATSNREVRFTTSGFSSGGVLFNSNMRFSAHATGGFSFIPQNTYTHTTSANQTIYISAAFSPSSASSGSMYGIYNGLAYDDGSTTGNFTGEIIGSNNVTTFSSYQAGSHTFNRGIAVKGYLSIYDDNSGSGAITTNTYGGWFEVNDESSGARITNAYGLYSLLNAPYSQNNQTRYGLYVDAMPNPGVFTGTTTAAIRLAGTGGARDGILFGSDTNLFRSAADTLKTDDSLVVASNLTVNTLTSTRIAYAGASGLLQDSANMTFDGNRISLATTGNTGGLLIGGDANLYRSAADTLKTDDSFIVGTNLSVLNAGTFSLYESGSVNFSSFVAGTQAADLRYTLPTSQPSTNQVLTATSISGAGPYDITLGWAAPSATISIGSGITSGTDGSVLFVGSGAVLAQDNSNFFWDDTNNYLGLGTAATPAARLHVAGNQTASAWTTNGILLRVGAATLTDSSSSGTVAASVANAIQTPTFAASSVTTYTDAATLYISANPTAGTNVTITNGYALWVDSGATRLDGNLIVGTLTSTRIPYASTGGLLVDSANMTFDGNRIALATTGNTGGLLIGGDTNLYRSSADVLSTDDSFTTGGSISAGTNIVAQSGYLSTGVGGGGFLGEVRLLGDTSGTISILPQSSAGTYNFNLPTTAGSSGYVLTSAGGGASPMTWTDPGALAVRWNSIANPTSNQSLTMSTYTTTWNWATGTSTNNLFNLTTDASANGTGALLRIATGTSSTVVPLLVVAAGTTALTVNASAQVLVNSLTSGRVTFAGTSGLLTDSSSFTYTTGTGQLALATSGSGAGLLLGGDALLYRDAADILRTPDSLRIDVGLGVGASAPASTAGKLQVTGTNSTINTEFNNITSTTTHSNSSGSDATVRTWAMRFTMTQSGTSNFNDASALGGTGMEGLCTFSGSGTAAGMHGIIGKVTNTSSGTLTRACGVLSDLSSANTGAGHITNVRAVDIAWNTAFSANNQVRCALRIGAGPTNHGSFTGSITGGIYFNSSSRGVQDGIIWGTGGDTNLYSSASDTLKTDDSFVVGANLTVNTLTSGRVPFASTSGLLVDSSAFTYTTGTGQLALTTTGSSAGLMIGGDALIYRSAANTMSMGASDSFEIPSGFLGVGVAAPTSATRASFAYTASVGSGTERIVLYNGGVTSAHTGFFNNVQSEAATSHSTGTVNWIAGALNRVRLQSTGGTVTTSYGLHNMAWMDSASGTVTYSNNTGVQCEALWNNANFTGTATVSNNIAINAYNVHTTITGGGTVSISSDYGLYAQCSVNTGITITTRYGIRIADTTGSTGTLTTQYGLYLEDLDRGSTNYGIYFAGTSGASRQGIWWNADTNLYRSAADTLKTDDAFVSGSTITGASSLTLGAAGGTTGSILLKGTTSGTVTVTTAAAAGTWSLTLPTSGGTNGYVLTTNGSGTTSWNAPGIPWTEVTGTSQSASAHNGYITNNAALVTVTLPTPAVGSVVEIVGLGAGGWKAQCGSTHTIRMGTVVSAGTGYAASTNQYDCVKIVGVSATAWLIVSAVGTIDIV